MIYSILQLVDLSIFVFWCHTLTFSMWSKATPLWIDLLDYYMTKSAKHQFHLSTGALGVEEFRENILSSIIFYEYSLIYAIQVGLSSCNLVTLPLMEGSPHVSWICWIIDLSHLHSRLASWIIRIFKWFEKVVTIVFLTDLQDIIVLP